jgi:uncharacterized SAM-binding protein YcdF (DUF218 family)
MKMDGRKRRLKRGTVILAVATFFIAFGWHERSPILQKVGSWWVVSDDLSVGDAIVVLGGEIDVRPFAAADLYKRGLAKIILVSNVRMGRAEILGLVPSHTQLNCDVLSKLGVPPTAIVRVGDNLSSTHEEAQAVRTWAALSGARRIIVPTDLFASRRTRWIFERELASIGVAVNVQAFAAPDYTLGDWWRDRYGLIDFNNEILKYVYYRIKYR